MVLGGRLGRTYFINISVSSIASACVNTETDVGEFIFKGKYGRALPIRQRSMSTKSKGTKTFHVARGWNTRWLLAEKPFID